MTHDDAKHDPPPEETLPAAPGPRARSLDAEAMRQRIGERLFGGDERPTYLGRFRVLRTLGVGGMGVVYAAEDDLLHRVVALKVIREDILQREGDRQRILREARALARLSHPHVVQLHEVVTAPEAVFLVMEYVAGTTLHQWLRAEPRDVPAILAVFAAASRGLAAAHRVGIVHRDIKPSNILIGEDGRVRIVDFGLARGAGPAPARDDATSPTSGPTPRRLAGPETVDSGTVAGTPAYMAPEAFFASEVDARSDQFSFCVTLFESLYGERPFGAGGLTGPESLRRALEFPAAPPVPVEVRRMLGRGLSARPAERFAAMDELTALLEPRPRATRRGAIVLLLAALVGAGAFLARARDEPAPRCAPAPGELAGIWDAATRESVRKAMLLPDQPFSARLVAPVERQLDRYAARWLAARIDTCEATWVRGEQSEELLDRSMNCLSQRRLALAGLVEQLQRRDPHVVSAALELADDLPDIDACRDGGRLLRARSQRSDDPRLASVRSKLVHAAVLGWSREGISAVSLADSALRELRPLGDWSTEAEALQLRGRLRARELGDLPGGLADLHAAYDRAVAAGDDTIAANVWLELAELAALLQQDAVEARRYLEHARETLDRVGTPTPIDEARLLDTEGRILWLEEKFPPALELHQRALELRLAHLAPGHPDLVRSRLRVANATADAGDVAAAARLCTELRRDVALQFGDDHPATALLELAEAQHLAALARHDKAREHLLHARPHLLRSYGPRTPYLAVLDLELSALEAAAGDLPRAIARAREALRLVTEILPSHHTLRVEALANLADYLSQARDRAGELEVYRELLVLHDRHGLEIDLASLLYNIGDCLCRLGRCAEGYDVFLRLLEQSPRGAKRALSLYGIGFAHLDGGRPALALPPLEEARRLLAAEPDALPHVAVDVARLLARNLAELHREPRRVQALLTEAAIATRDLAPR